MTDNQGPSIIVNEPRIKLVLAILGMVGLGYTVGAYILEKEYRLRAVEEELVAQTAKYNHSTELNEKKFDRLRDDFNKLDRDYSLFRAWVQDRLRNSPIDPTRDPR